MDFNFSDGNMKKFHHYINLLKYDIKKKKMEFSSIKNIIKIPIIQ